jgi:chemosensory pili system protein ChpA (sensor histidine kinase/response regulator)
VPVEPRARSVAKLSSRLKPADPAAKTELETRPIDLSKVRNAYELLLLRVFKQNASQKDLNNIVLLLGVIANDTSQAHAYSFWRSCQTVVANLQATNEGLELGVKRWLGRLNLQIQRLTSGSKHLSEHLFREALFYIAHSKTSTELSEQHHALAVCYALQGSVPNDLKHRRYGQAIPADISTLLNKLNALKLAWDDAAPSTSEGEGVASQLTMQLRRIRTAYQLALDLQLCLSEHHLPTLVGVAQSLAQSTGIVADTGKPLPKNLGIEGAKAILWLEETLKHPGQPHALQLEQAQLMIGRLGITDSSDALLLAQSPTPNNATQLLMGEVIREAMSSLSSVEKQLDNFFRYRNNLPSLSSSLTLLAQTRSTLSLLGLPEAGLAIRSIEQQIKGFIEQTHEATPAAFSALAVLFSQVTALLDLFTLMPERAQNDFVFNEAKGGLVDTRTVTATDSNIDETLSFDSIESLSQQRRSDAQALIKNVAAKPDDAGARQALVESIQALKDDAALTGDRSLSALSAVDLSPVSVIGTYDAITNEATESASLEAAGPGISDGAKTLAQLDALLATHAAPLPLALPTARSEDDLYGIFLEEAQSVLNDALQLLADLEENPGSTPALTDLRRNFHTLKGSSRMVGFKAFGDAAWHVEQVVNHALTLQAPASMDLIQFMRCGREALATWLIELDDTLLGMDLEAFNSSNSAPDFTVASNVAAFTLKLAPYFQAIERSNARTSTAPSEASDASPLTSISLASPSTSDALPWTSLASPSTSDALPSAIDTLPSLTLPVIEDDPLDTQVAELTTDTTSHEAAVTTQPEVIAANLAPSELTQRPKISLVANNEGLRPQDFIEKARMAVVKAQASESSVLTESEPSIALQPVQISPALVNHSSAPQDNMVSIGPLRLPKPLYDIYLVEASQHITGLKNDLAVWHSQPARPSLYEAYRHAHSLKGSAATIGFGVMKELAAALETVLQLSVESEIELVGDDLFALDKVMRSIQSVFDSFSIGLYPVANPSDLTDLSALLNQLTQRSKTAAVTVPPLPSSQDSAVSQKLMAQAHSAAHAADALALVELEQSVAATASTQLAQPQAVSKDFLDVYSTESRRTNVASAEDSTEDEIDQDIWVNFVEEADSILPRTQNSLVDAPKAIESLNDLRRDLHTLKGSARMAGALRMGALLHSLESKLEQSVQPNLPFISPSAHDSLLDAFDDIYSLYEGLKNVSGSNPVSATVDTVSQTSPFLAMMADTNALLNGALSAPKNPFLFTPAPSIDLVPVAIMAPLPSETKPVAPAPLAIRTEAAESAPAPSDNALVLPAMRIRTEVLDHLVNQASELSTSKGRIDQHVAQLKVSLRELTDNVERLRRQLREIEIQAESQMATRTELASSEEIQFDPLEFDRFTRFQELTRMLTESLNDMIAVRDSVSKSILDTERELTIQGKANKDLTQSLMRSRLLSFDAISDRLFRVVRQAARELGKQVALDIRGGHLTLDRAILERMTAGLEHLVRNCVVHGIEIPSIRSALGKPAQGTITIALSQKGNEFEIDLSDDGSGLALERIRDTALAKGLLSNQTLPTVQQLSDLIFTPGFSTADSITELAGRGVGMDVVRSDVISLGGRITLSTTPRQGTRFSIRLPQTLAINQVLMVMAQQVQYAIPTSLIQTVVSVKPSDLAQAYSQGRISQGTLSYPFSHLSELLNIPATAALQNKSVSVILLSNGADFVAVHVDTVIGNHEAVVKPLSSAMLRIPGLSSATLLGDGKICFILDPVQLQLSRVSAPATPLVAAFSQPSFKLNLPERENAYTLTTQRTSTQDSPSAMVQVVSTRHADGFVVPVASRLNRLAMVIDDSLTVRKVTQKLLLREGWEVLLAKDGIDALEQLQTANPVVLLVDIEMPRMDGFDLTRNVRADERLKHIPIIMITSRIADKHRDYAFTLGVNAYMGKPYRDDELVAEMIKLTTVTA